MCKSYMYGWMDEPNGWEMERERERDANIKIGTHVMHIKVLQKFAPLKRSNNNFRFPTLIRICMYVCIFLSLVRDIQAKANSTEYLS